MSHLLHRFFLALFPPAEVLPALRRHSDPRGWAVADERLHVTMLWLGDFSGAQPGLLARVFAALGDANLPAAAVAFDRLVAAPGRRLLVPGAPLAEARALHARLVATLAGAGVGWMKARFSPHVTLGYPRDVANGTRAIPPVGWQARELVLVESLLGRGRHLAHGRWPLESHRTM